MPPSSSWPRRRRALPSRLAAFLVVAVVAAIVGHDAAKGAPVGVAASNSPFVVAIDPGHGGSNLGAVGPDGLYEKDVTLALARQLRARLEAASSDVHVVMCRDGDVLVPIRARARCAAEAHAVLFVSLHANATPPGVAPGSQRGFELYVLPPEDVDDDANLAALGTPGAGGIWAAHIVRAVAERSVAAAETLDLSLRRAIGPGLARGIRQSGAALDVLRGTGAASVLVEVGFLDNAADRFMLASDAGRDRLAGALAGAVLTMARSAATR